MPDAGDVTQQYGQDGGYTWWESLHRICHLDDIHQEDHLTCSHILLSGTPSDGRQLGAEPLRLVHRISSNLYPRTCRLLVCYSHDQSSSYIGSCHLRLIRGDNIILRKMPLQEKCASGFPFPVYQSLHPYPSIFEQSPLQIQQQSISAIVSSSLSAMLVYILLPASVMTPLAVSAAPNSSIYC